MIDLSLIKNYKIMNKSLLNKKSETHIFIIFNNLQEIIKGIFKKIY